MLREQGDHPNQVSRVSTETTSSKGLFFLNVLLTTLSVPSADIIDSELQAESAMERSCPGVCHNVQCVAKFALLKMRALPKCFGT